MFAAIGRLGHRIGPVVRVLLAVIVLAVAAVFFKLVIVTSTLSPASNLVAMAVLIGLTMRQLIALRHWLERESWAGALLLNASDDPSVNPDRRLAAIIWYLLAVGGFTCTVAFWNEIWDTAEGRLLPTSTLLFTFVATSYLSSAFTRGKLEFREMGICNETSFLHWNEIESWSWDARATDEGLFVLLVQPHSPSTRTRMMRIHVLPTKHEAVAQTMSTYVSRC